MTARSSGGSGSPDSGNGGLSELLSYLVLSRGVDLNAYKRATLGRRITARMSSVGVQGHAEYIDYLEVHPDEFEQLFNTILINVTSFFRDQPAWDYVREHVIPELIEQSEPDTPIRVWSAGCSSGEEPFSLAMLFAEALGEAEYGERVKIYATDVDEDALDTARQATYSRRQMEGVPEALLEKYWDATDAHYVCRRELRRNVIFGRHDLTTDAPISRVDLLVSRNTLMYFNAEAQERVLLRFHFALTESGRLFLGRAETLLTRSQLFTPVDARARVFAKVPRPLERERIVALVGSGGEPRPARRHTGGLADSAFDMSPVPAIVIDAEGRVQHVNRRARELFELSSAHIGRPIQDLSISYRPADLRSAIDDAYGHRRPALIPAVSFAGRDQTERWFDIQVLPLMSARGVPVGASITFIDVSRERSTHAELETTRHQLETAYEELQSSNEELETTNEELQSAVEELETTNEELQAANEELETINEELQSTNEELETVNVELNERSSQLDSANAFLESVLMSLPVGVIVLGTELRVRAWNGRAEELWGVRSDEARGHLIHELELGLPVAQLSEALAHGLRGTSGQRVVPARDRRGRPFDCRVSVEPLQGSSARVEGVLMLMAEQDGAAE